MASAGQRISLPVTGPERSTSRCKYCGSLLKVFTTKPFQIEHDVNHVFDDTGDGGEFVGDAIDSYSRNGGAIERRKQHSSQSVAEGRSITALQGLNNELTVDRAIGSCLMFSRHLIFRGSIVLSVIYIFSAPLISCCPRARGYSLSRVKLYD